MAKWGGDGVKVIKYGKIGRVGIGRARIKSGGNLYALGRFKENCSTAMSNH
jgi:hypothetical protein